MHTCVYICVLKITRYISTCACDFTCAHRVSICQLFSPPTFPQLQMLDNVWRNHLQQTDLWEPLAQYVHMSGLRVPQWEVNIHSTVLWLTMYMYVLDRLVDSSQPILDDRFMVVYALGASSCVFDVTRY